LVGVMGVGFLVSACAGPGQAPKTADLLFPLPYLIKNHGSGTSTPAPEGVEARQ
jgi:hypothetical protein